MNATAQKKIVPNKVLVTGASGLLGAAAIERFLSAGWEVVGVSRRKPELPAGWSSKEQIETNNAMLRNVVQPIVRTAPNFQHISILQGTKIYGVHLHPIPIPARERDARKDHPQTSSSTRKPTCLRWAPSAASTTRHC